MEHSELVKDMACRAKELVGMPMTELRTILGWGKTIRKRARELTGLSKGELIRMALIRQFGMY